ncbi:MAG: hypothetical protein AAGJ35_11595, partial [Myxococcota bacterium]
GSVGGVGNGRGSYSQKGSSKKGAHVHYPDEEGALGTSSPLQPPDGASRPDGRGSYACCVSRAREIGGWFGAGLGTVWACALAPL